MKKIIDKVSARPPVKQINHLEEMEKAFIKDGSIEKNKTEKSIVIYPWDGSREDVYKTFNLRLQEEYALKLDYLALKTKTSKHTICMRVVKKEIDELLKQYEKSLE